MAKNRSNGTETMDGDAREVLVAFATRLLRLDEEIAGLKSDRKDLLKEVEGAGFEKALFQQAVKAVRDEAVDTFRQKVAITDLYLDALASFDTTPLSMAAAASSPRTGRAADALHSHA